MRQISREQSIRIVDKFFVVGISLNLNEEVDPVSVELFYLFKTTLIVTFSTKLQITYGRWILTHVEVLPKKST